MARGFTLVELLVVVLIIGLGISVVGINLGGNSNYQLQTDAKKFADQVSLLEEQAVLDNRQWGVDLFRETVDGEERFGYRWMELSDDNKRRWQQPEDEAFTEEYLFAPGVELRLQLDGLDAEQPIEYKQKLPAASDDVSEKDKRADVINENNEIADEQKLEPEIWLLSSGEMNAFEVTFYNRQSPDSLIKVTGDELGRVKLDTGEADAQESR